MSITEGGLVWALRRELGSRVVRLGFHVLGPTVYPLLKHEREAQRALAEDLSAHLDLARRLPPLIEYAMGRAFESPTLSEPARAIAAKLLARMYDDIRCAVLLAERGYPLQAASITATLYELGFTVALVCADFDLARRWVEHDDPTHPWLTASELSRRARKFMNDPNADETAAGDYKNYRQLCMAKHANPIMELQHGHEVEGHTVTLTPGPDTTEAGILVAMFALEHAALYALIAITYFTTHIAPDQRGRLPEFVEELGRERIRLRQQAITRWGSDDPFPNRW